MKVSSNDNLNNNIINVNIDSTSQAGVNPEPMFDGMKVAQSENNMEIPQGAPSEKSGMPLENRDIQPSQVQEVSKADETLNLIGELSEEEAKFIEQFEVEDFEALLGKVNDGIVKFSDANKNKLTKADYGSNFFTKSYYWRHSKNYKYSGERDLMLVRYALFRAIEKRYGFDQETLKKIANDLELGKANVGGLDRLKMKEILANARARAFEDKSVLNEFFVNDEGQILHATELKGLDAQTRETFKPCFSRNPSDVKLLFLRRETSALSRPWEDADRNKVSPEIAVKNHLAALTKELKDACMVKGSNPPVYNMTGASIKALVGRYRREAQNVRKMVQLFGQQIKAIKEQGDKPDSDVEKSVLNTFAKGCAVNSLDTLESTVINDNDLFKKMFSILLCDKSTLPMNTVHQKAGRDPVKMKNIEEMKSLYTSILKDFVKEDGENLVKGGDAENLLIKVFGRFSKMLQTYAKAMKTDVKNFSDKISAAVDGLKITLNTESAQELLTEARQKEIEGWQMEMENAYKEAWKPLRFKYKSDNDIDISQPLDRKDDKNPLTDLSNKLTTQFSERMALVKTILTKKENIGSGMIATIGKHLPVMKFPLYLSENNGKMFNVDKSAIGQLIFNNAMRNTIDDLVQARWNSMKKDDLITQYNTLKMCCERKACSELTNETADKDIKQAINELVSKIKNDTAALRKCYEALIADEKIPLGLVVKIYDANKNFFSKAMAGYQSAYDNLDYDKALENAGISIKPEKGSIEDRYYRQKLKEEQDGLEQLVKPQVNNMGKATTGNTEAIDVIENFEGVPDRLKKSFATYNTRVNYFNDFESGSVRRSFNLALVTETKSLELKNLSVAMNSESFALFDNGEMKKRIEAKIKEEISNLKGKYVLNEGDNGGQWDVTKAAQTVLKKIEKFVTENKSIAERLEVEARRFSNLQEKEVYKVLKDCREQYNATIKMLKQMLGDWQTAVKEGNAANAKINQLLSEALGDDADLVVKALKGINEGNSGFALLAGKFDFVEFCVENVQRRYESRMKTIETRFGMIDNTKKSRVAEAEAKLNRKLPEDEVKEIGRKVESDLKDQAIAIWNGGTDNNAYIDNEVVAAFKTLKNVKALFDSLDEHLGDRLATLGLRIKDVYSNIGDSGFSPDDDFAKRRFSVNHYMQYNGLGVDRTEVGSVFTGSDSYLHKSGDAPNFSVNEMLRQISTLIVKTLAGGYVNFNTAETTEVMKKNTKAQIDEIVKDMIVSGNALRTGAYKGSERNMVITHINMVLNSSATEPYLKRYPNAEVFRKALVKLSSSDLDKDNSSEGMMARDLRDMIDNRIAAAISAFSTPTEEHPCGCYLHRVDVFKTVAQDIVNDLGRLSEVVVEVTREHKIEVKNTHGKVDRQTTAMNFIDKRVDLSQSKGFISALMKQQDVKKGNFFKSLVSGGISKEGESMMKWQRMVVNDIFSSEGMVGKESSHMYFYRKAIAGYCKASNDYCRVAHQVKQVTVQENETSLDKMSFADFAFDEEDAKKGMRREVDDVLNQKVRQHHPQMAEFEKTWQKNKDGYRNYIIARLKKTISAQNAKTKGIDKSYNEVQIEHMANQILADLWKSRTVDGVRSKDTTLAFGETDKNVIVMHQMDTQTVDNKGVPTGKWKDAIDNLCDRKINADQEVRKKISSKITAFANSFSETPKNGGRKPLEIHLGGQLVCTSDFITDFMAEEMKKARSEGSAYDLDGLILRLETKMRESGIAATRADWCRLWLRKEQAESLTAFGDGIRQIANQLVDFLGQIGMTGFGDADVETMVANTLNPFVENLINVKLEAITADKDFSVDAFKKHATQLKVLTELCGQLGLSHKLEKNKLVLVTPDGNTEGDFVVKRTLLDKIRSGLQQQILLYSQLRNRFNEENKAKSVKIEGLGVIFRTYVAEEGFHKILSNLGGSALLKGVRRKENHNFLIDRSKSDIHYAESLTDMEFIEENWRHYLGTSGSVKDEGKIASKTELKQNQDFASLLQN